MHLKSKQQHVYRKMWCRLSLATYTTKSFLTGHAAPIVSCGTDRQLCQANASTRANTDTVSEFTSPWSVTCIEAQDAVRRKHEG